MQKTDLKNLTDLYIHVCVCVYIHTHMYKLGMRGIPVLEKYRYLLYFKRYDIIILLISVFHTNPVNLTTEQRDGSNRLNSINAPEMNK